MNREFWLIMEINIIGFNIFAKGGTSRSNINLIKAFLQDGHKINYFNKQNFDQSQITKLIIHENIHVTNFNVYSLDEEELLSKGDILIITREDLFHYARIAKMKNKNIKIVGEIHGPLEYIRDDIDLALEAVDTVRVSTESIKKAFMKKYDFENVFNFYVNAQHIKINEVPQNTRRNLLVKARFEDNIKDISYAIKLVKYIIKNTDRQDIQLYIKGYGPSEMLYKNLVRYYGLQKNVHINEREPINYVYVSTSPYETLGYSILETLAGGNQALVYRGNDNVLEEVYHKYHGIKFLDKDLEKDSEIVLNIFENKYTKEQRQQDVELLENEFVNNDYASNYLKYLNESLKSVEKKQHRFGFKKVKKNKEQSSHNKIDTYNKIKSNKLFKKLISNKFIYDRFKKVYENEQHKLEHKVLDDIPVDEDKVFIESFHGSNFSSDPKYIALKINELYPHKKIYVSSVNSLVDMEIRNHGFTPIRFGSLKYKETFRSCKYVFMNGNSWDKVFKGENQVFIQTWHGFPLKKMVNDLGNVQEKEKQFQQFLPRMLKWDYLITSSDINTMLLKSAFLLEKNEELKVLEYGAPKNEYLINKNDINERTRVQNKYLLETDMDKKYILYCPTWRKGERKSVTQLNLKKLIEFLPEKYEIIVKLHPNESKLRAKYNNLSRRIHCFYNELVDIQELYILCDAMITDYSSTIFDFMHLNKPIFLLQEDSDEYKKEIGFYFDIDEIGSFPKAMNDEARLAQQLTKIKEINYSDVVKVLLSKDSTHSSEMILSEIFNA